MKKIWQELRQANRQFYRHWFLYLALFISVDLIIQLIWIPIFRLITTFTLQAGEIPFVSYQNVVTIVTRHPFVVLVLLAELVAILLVVYGQFAMILLGVQEIKTGQLGVCRLIKATLTRLKDLRFSSLLVLLGYFVLVVPFADLVFRTPLLAKVQIPQFILDYLTRSALLLTVLLAFYAVMIILGVRFLYALPLMVYRGQRPKAALRTSWYQTRHGKWWPAIARLIVVGLAGAIVVAILYAATVGAQFAADRFLGKGAYYFGIFDMLVVQLGSEFFAAWVGTVTINVIFKQLVGPAGGGHFTISRGLKAVTVVAVSLLTLVTVVGNALYLSGSEDRRPVTVSHRGVADENGVQNTIPAMEKTHRLHPDYIEMDVHETKDHQFVVLHDENLKELTGVNKTPHQLTLRQLTRLTARENGHQAKIASFDDYLKTADRLHQKLLVEVKTTPQDSAGMLRRFVRQYGPTLVAYHDQLHSLDYSVVTGLKKYDPHLDVLYVQPYNFTYPNTVANGYSMEYSTLTYDFITLAHLQHKCVYAWTVNDDQVMKQMMYKNVDGIITDNLVELNKAIASYEGQQSYARRILTYIMVVPTSTEFAP
jgi:glycerophosphoryl diester phosphodiesterase